MKLLRSLFLLLVTPGLVWAQSSAQVTDASQNNPDVATELKALREALLQTQKQMTSQQREIEALRDQVKTGQASQAGSEQAPSVIDAAMNTAIPSSAMPAGNFVGANAGQQSMPLDKGQAQESTPTFRIGSADIRLGGFVDIENIYRTTNTQNNIATNYAAIPYSDTPQGHLSEYRLTAQFSLQHKGHRQNWRHGCGRLLRSGLQRQ